MTFWTIPRDCLWLVDANPASVLRTTFAQTVRLSIIVHLDHKVSLRTAEMSTVVIWTVSGWTWLTCHSGGISFGSTLILIGSCQRVTTSIMSRLVRSTTYQAVILESSPAIFQVYIYQYSKGHARYKCTFAWRCYELRVIFVAWTTNPSCV